MVFGADKKPRAKNWTWTYGGEKLKPAEQKRRFEQFRKAGISAVLFSSFNADVLACAKDHGRETHAWTWALRRGDKELLETHPDWCDVNRLGESVSDKPARSMLSNTSRRFDSVASRGRLALHRYSSNALPWRQFQDAQAGWANAAAY